MQNSVLTFCLELCRPLPDALKHENWSLCAVCNSHKAAVLTASWITEFLNWKIDQYNSSKLFNENVCPYQALSMGYHYCCYYDVSQKAICTRNTFNGIFFLVSCGTLSQCCTQTTVGTCKGLLFLLNQWPKSQQLQWEDLSLSSRSS